MSTLGCKKNFQPQLYTRYIISPKKFNFGISCPKVAIFIFLPKSGPYLAYFAPLPSGPGGPKIFFQRLLYTTGSYSEKIFGFSSAHLRYLPILPFSTTTQLAIFRIEYNHSESPSSEVVMSFKAKKQPILTNWIVLVFLMI